MAARAGIEPGQPCWSSSVTSLLVETYVGKELSVNPNEEFRAVNYSLAMHRKFWSIEFGKVWSGAVS